MQTKPDIVINPNSVNTPTSSVVLNYFTSAATRDGIVDAQPQLQAEIDYCIANGISRLFLPKGRYKLNAPLFLSFSYNGSYNGFALELFGEGNMWDSKTVLEPTFTDRFIVGIQLGKGVTLRGLHIKGLYNIPLGDNYTYYKRTFEEVTDGVCRDSRYSPYCAIAIDPVSNSASQIPTDGGYPNMTSYYKGGGGVGGSTATQIIGCIIEKVVVGICSSPNGFTRNAEITHIQDVQFKYNKLCISGGQDQEKANTVYNIACWYDSHTIFATGKYGAGSVGHWNIDTVNLAGRVVRFIDNEQSGYFPTFIKNVYSEGLGTWGYMSNNSNQASVVSDCIIGFALPLDSLSIPLYISGNNIIYRGCTFRHYGKGFPIPIAGTSVYENCSFSGFPIYSGQYLFPQFINCRAGSAFLGWQGVTTLVGSSQFHPCGDWSLYDYNVNDFNIGGVYGVHNVIKSNSQDIYTTLPTDTNVSVSVSSGVATFTSSNPDGYFLNGYVTINGNNGIVTNISGSVITVSYLSRSLTSGSYSVLAFYGIYYTNNFIGDTTGVNNQILNCRIGKGGNSLTSLVGYVFKNPYGGSKYIKILTASGTTLTFYGSITSTKIGAVFGNYGRQELYTDYPTNSIYQAGIIMRKGDMVIEMKGTENQVEHKVTKGGFLSGDSDTRQAALTTI